jgi:hypothetical protein
MEFWRGYLLFVSLHINIALLTSNRILNSSVLLDGLSHDDRRHDAAQPHSTNRS